MNFNSKSRYPLHILLILILLFITGSFISVKSPIIFADEKKASEEECSCPKAEDLDVIIIDNKGYKKDRISPSKFEHLKHITGYQISCLKCHHEYKDNKGNPEPQAAQVTSDAKTQDTRVNSGAQGTQDNKEVQKNPNIWSPWGKTKKCSECHDPNEKKGNVVKLQVAYHKNCKGCHKEERIYKDDYLAYRKCTKCHE